MKLRRLVLGAALALPLPLQAQETIAVAVAPLGELVTAMMRDAPAHAVSLNESRIEAEISARLVEFKYNVGDQVESGAVLARLDCRNYRHERDRAKAQLKILEARLALAEQQLQRVRSLQKDKNVSEEVVNQRETETTTLHAEIDAQQVMLGIVDDNISRCTVKAPFAGVIVERPAQLGELAAPGKALFELLDTRTVELSARLQVRDVASLRERAAGQFLHNGHEYPVSLRRVVPAIDTNTGTQEARLRFSSEAIPPPGAPGRLRWRHQASALPAHLLVRRDGVLGVMVADGERARFVVLPGAREGRSVAVSLPPQTLIITRGRHGLADGDDITVP